MDGLHEDAGGVGARDRGEPGLRRHGETDRERKDDDRKGATPRAGHGGGGAQKGSIKASTGAYVGKGTVHPKIRIQVQSSVFLKKLRTSQISLGCQGFRRLESCQTGRNEPLLKHQTSGSEKIMIATSFFQ